MVQKYALMLIFITNIGCSSADMAGSNSSKEKAKSKEVAVETDSDTTTTTKKPTTVDSEDPLIDDEPSTSSLEVKPESLRLFKGESASLTAVYKDDEKDEIDVSNIAKWKSDNTNVFKVSADGEVAAIDAGEGKVSVSHKDSDGSATVFVIKCKSFGTGSDATRIRVKGENWPGNNIDPGGADFDDYFVVLSGSFTSDGYQIFSKVDQEFTVDFSIGSTGSTSQTVKLQAVDCDGKPMDSVSVSDVTGQQKVKAAKGDRFNLITTAVTGSTTRTYDLLVDKANAFRVVVEQ